MSGADGQDGPDDEADFVQLVRTRVAEGECTLMLRNIACKFTKEDVKRILDDMGMRGRYSFVAVPRLHTGRSNFGYAFVCCRSRADAEACFRLCDGRILGETNATKLCRVVLANIQGGAEAVLRSRGLRERDPEILYSDELPPVQPPEAWELPPTALRASAAGAPPSCRRGAQSADAAGSEARDAADRSDDEPPQEIRFDVEVGTMGPSELFEDPVVGPSDGHWL
mmetsp:Transcript_64982/g.181673  ORF Transcript_64982/g.181673 Transcript_64982/m.181673 type:complete len:225 (-) Transcript_64982:504-1178(-)